MCFVLNEVVALKKKMIKSGCMDLSSKKIIKLKGSPVVFRSTSFNLAWFNKLISKFVNKTSLELHSPLKGD